CTRAEVRIILLTRQPALEVEGVAQGLPYRDSGLRQRVLAAEVEPIGRILREEVAFLALQRDGDHSAAAPAPPEIRAEAERCPVGRDVGLERQGRRTISAGVVGLGTVPPSQADPPAGRVKTEGRSIAGEIPISFVEGSAVIAAFPPSRR